jgi:alkanesulfonate monooxygenase SsuD/methylene tetrahydromethanopterin reductase-like flavin-dependent oxidoreductase (luciferase family)
MVKGDERRLEVHSAVPPFRDLQTLVEAVERLDALGVSGVFVPDHLFISHGVPRREASGSPDPPTLLASIGAISPRMSVGSIVCNIGLRDPVLLFRQFAQLAQLLGGERVVAGIGAGWNPEEYDAVGCTMPAYMERMDRLEEALHIGRSLFDDGFSVFNGDHFTTRNLPLSPRPEQPPRLMVGGGSDRLLKLAGRYADAIDLSGSSRRTGLAGRHPYQSETRRRLSTTVEDLERSIAIVRSEAADAGRSADAVSFSVAITHIRFGSTTEVEAWERDLCQQAGLKPRSLSECPYVIAGSPLDAASQLRERLERLQLRSVMMLPGPELETVMTKVVPLLSPVRHTRHKD